MELKIFITAALKSKTFLAITFCVGGPFGR